MRRLAIISDIHGNLPALEAVLDDISGLGVTELYHLGDLVGYNPFPNEVVAKVRQLGLPGITGNYDRAVVARVPDPVGTYLNPAISPMAREIYHWTKAAVTPETAAFLAALPEQAALQLNGCRVLLTHGSPRHLREYILPHLTDAELAVIVADVAAQVILTGHTHRPLVRRVDGKWLINPGSVGFPKDGDPRASYALVDLDEDLQVEIRRVAYDVEATADALLAQGLPDQAAQDLRRGGRARRKT